jgi:hypothetical protein
MRFSFQSSGCGERTEECRSESRSSQSTANSAISSQSIPGRIRSNKFTSRDGESGSHHEDLVNVLGEVRSGSIASF